VSDREQKADRIVLNVVCLATATATAAALVSGGVMLVLAWLLIALLGAT
jgi:hypothetical protein